MRDWLRVIRQDKGFSSCKALAIEVGISESHYTSIENGRRTPSTNIAKRIGTALDFPWTSFFEDIEDTK